MRAESRQNMHFATKILTNLIAAPRDSLSTDQRDVISWIALVTLGLGSDASTTEVVLILAGCAVLSVTIFAGMPSCFLHSPWSECTGVRGEALKSF